MENLIARPTLSGVMRESPDYTNMGVGFTDRIFLVGHADGLALGDPHQVMSMRQTLRLIGTDPTVPLVQALLEAYYGGARDIWIIAAAPMSEYVENLADRFDANPAWAGKNFYEQYYDRLQFTYDLLKGFELPQLLVPLNAPLYDAGSVDFVTQLATHCNEAFDATGSVRIGIIGTAVDTWNDAVVDDMVSDPRWAAMNDVGKFVLPVVGSGLFNIRETVTTHSGPLAAVVAASACQAPINRGMTNRRLPQVINISHADFTSAQLEKICNAKLNPVSRSVRSKRGRAFETVLLTDNMLAANGSDFWSFAQVRLVMYVIDNLRRLGKRHLGTVGYGQFKTEVTEFLLEMSMDNVLRNFDVSFDRNQNTAVQRFSETVTISVSLQPYFGVRTLTFQAEVGPGV